MNTNVIGTTSANGYPFLNFEDRFALYEKCGYGAVMLWWGEGEKEARVERVSLAKKYNLVIENVHSDMDNSNSLWLPGDDGDKKMLEHISAIKDCHKYGIERMVMHLTNGNNPPEISAVGLHRFENIFACAIENDVTIAIENVRTSKHIIYILDHYNDKHITFCFDTGHANIWCKNIDWLSLYHNRLSVIHIHDNGADKDTHDIPQSGTVDWKKLIHSIRNSAYTGCLALETEYRGDVDINQLEVFLRNSYESGLTLAKLS